MKEEEMLLVKIFKGYSLLVNRHNNGEEGSEDWCGIPTGAKTPVACLRQKTGASGGIIYTNF
ncbi:hypothetical protein [Ferruginibacter sp.]|nr:hypothetical protein [Ferruginibacter sp.]